MSCCVVQKETNKTVTNSLTFQIMREGKFIQECKLINDVSIEARGVFNILVSCVCNLRGSFLCRLSVNPRASVQIECFHLTRRRPCWRSERKKQLPSCWRSEIFFWELNSIFMTILPFVLVCKYGTEIVSEHTLYRLDRYVARKSSRDYSRVTRRRFQLEQSRFCLTDFSGFILTVQFDFHLGRKHKHKLQAGKH